MDVDLAQHRVAAWEDVFPSRAALLVLGAWAARQEARMHILQLRAAFLRSPSGKECRAQRCEGHKKSCAHCSRYVHAIDRGSSYDCWNSPAWSCATIPLFSLVNVNGCKISRSGGYASTRSGALESEAIRWQTSSIGARGVSRFVESTSRVC